MNEIMRTEQLCKIYSMGQIKVSAVNGIDLSIQRGEFVSIMGPSGCGKSTLLSLLGGLTKPTSGNLYIDRNNITEYSYTQLARMRKKYVGFVFQTLNLLPSLKVIDNLKIVLKISRRNEKSGAFDPAQLLEQFGLKNKLKNYPHQLSYGEQQRVAIARAIVHKPAILFADEPTGNLDSGNTENVLGILKRLHKDYSQTIIMITHDPEVAHAAERVLHMKDGKIQSIHHTSSQERLS